MTNIIRTGGNPMPAMAGRVKDLGASLELRPPFIEVALHFRLKKVKVTYE
jgi:hypothetical protein